MSRNKMRLGGNQNRAFDHTSTEGDAVPTGTDRRLAERFREFARIDRVSWYCHSSCITLSPAYGADVDRFFMADLREAIENIAGDHYGARYDADNGRIYVQNRNRSVNRL